MKIIKLALIIISISTLCSFGDVNFNLVFVDPEGTGFNAPQNAWMREEAQKGANLLGKVIAQNAHVNIMVNATEETPYAWAPAEYYKTINESHGKRVVLNAQDKILNEKNTPDTQWDGHIEFNVSQFPKSCGDEFRRTFIHELTHTLGFLNFQDPNSKELTYYNDYDKLFHDANGNPFLINHQGVKNSLTTNPKFNPSIELYACGDCIRKHNNGKCVKIYNPKIYECGASFAHVDRDAHPRSIMSDRKCPNEYSIWNKCELGIIEELGYKINWDNYCQIIRELYPATIALNVDGSVLEEADVHFKVIANQDFPKECFETEVIKDTDKKFSIMINKECKLVLVDKKTKKHIYTFKSDSKDKRSKINLANKAYEIFWDRIEINNKTKVNIQFRKA